MKFGQSFHRCQIPEWAPFYINYNASKNIFKTACIVAKEQETEADFTNLFIALSRNLRHVERFYNSKYAIIHETIALYDVRSGERFRLPKSPDLTRTKEHEIQDIRRIIIELRDLLQRLLWFGKVNRDAFLRIFRKLDKIGSPREFQQFERLLSEFHELQFVGQKRCLKDIEQIGLLIAQLTPTSSNYSPNSTKFSFSMRYSRPFSQQSTEYHSCERLSLHHAAASGLSETCQRHLKHIQKHVGHSISSASDPILLEDPEGYTPLHLGVLGGYAAVVRVLLESVRHANGTDKMTKDPVFQSMLGSLLASAIKLEFSEIVQIMITNHANISHQNSCGETSLYIASRSGRADYVKAILESSPSHSRCIELHEVVHGWTPLLIASIKGHLLIVKLLIAAGADWRKSDLSGWTAKEHAAFRGHMKTAEWLAALDRETPIQTQTASWLKPSGVVRPQHSVAREDESRLFVTLGPSNTRTEINAVDLSHSIHGHAPFIPSDLGYSLQISAIGATGASPIVHLPLLEDMTNEPWLYTSQDPKSIKLVFKIFRTSDYESAENILVGSGVALLQNLKQGLAMKRESLVRDYTIPILGKDSLQLMGTVTFSFLIVTPFKHSNATASTTQGFWNKNAHDGSTQVIGHRGSGANTAARTNLQIGENTVQSFLTAAGLGASCVEYDVQLTRDFVPVVFHDFLVMETGGDTPLQTMTYNQFNYPFKTQSPRGDLSNMAETRYLESNKSQGGQQRKPRSRSVNVYDDHRCNDLVNRMKITEDFMHNEIKGNVRGASIQEPATTLEQLLVELPESIAFNVELKYPMLWEAEDRGMELYAMELNFFVDTILSKIYHLGANRNITLSSFCPEICILLSVKQKDYPVLFINKAGSVPTGDIRAASLQQAIQFAKSWNLAGIVMLSEPFVMCPRLVQYAKRSGLVCGTYGNQNDDPKLALVQADAGIDALMVNKVRLISQTLAGTKRA